MLGSDLAHFLGTEHEITAITRENYAELRGSAFDALVNADGNSRRYWANQNILADFEASTVSVYRSMFDFTSKKYIYISSSDVYPDHSSPATTSENSEIDSGKLSPYGFHKYLSERIVENRSEDYLILRCSMLLGRVLKKGPFYDMLHRNPLYITFDSNIQLVSTEEVASVITDLVRRGAAREIFNVGGRGAFSFEDTGRYFSEPPRVSSEAERQDYEMNISKLNAIHALRESKEYLEEFLTRHKHGASI